MRIDDLKMFLGQLGDIDVHSYWVTPSGVDEPLEIRRTGQRDGSWLWCIKRAGWEGGAVLNREFQWEFNHSPSNRTDEEIERTRYKSLEEALNQVEAYLAKPYPARTRFDTMSGDA